MAEYKLEYKLKQQTPLIHFQHDQQGAALRPGEVKPKLDRYITERYITEKEGEKDKLPSEWLLGEKEALNYKMRIAAGKVITCELNRDNGYDIYYGNMGSGTKKKGVFSDDITLTIICFIPGLREKIEEYIADFFIVSNFGTMQNKGFGSYVIDGEIPDSDKIAAVLKEHYKAKSCYSFPRGEVGNNETGFKRIKTIYSIMKSGMNFYGYQRSLLFLYMHKKGIGNEKAWLKQDNMAPAIGKPTYHVNQHPAKYVRALLGVGDHIDFKNTLGSSDDEKRDKTEVKICSSEIERLESCIFFKIIGNNVYIVAKRIHGEIYDKTFTFSAALKKDEKISKKYKRAFTPAKASDSLETPSSKEFDIDDFLDYCVKRFNGNNGGTAILDKFNDTRGIRITEVK